jgi:plasmid stabilization system protein ParE
VQTLGEHPEIGRPIEDMAPEFRDWFIPFGQNGYVVRYRFDGSLVRHAREAAF